MRDISCDLQLAALQRLSDALIGLLVDFRFLGQVARWAVSLKDADLAFDGAGNLDKAATESQLPRSLGWAFTELSARSGQLTKRVDRLWASRQKAIVEMRKLPDYLHDTLTKLHGKPWRSTVLRECLDQLHIWPFAEVRSRANSPHLPNVLQPFVALVLDADPADAWEHYENLLSGFLDDLHAVRIEVRPIDNPSPLSEQAQRVLDLLLPGLPDLADPEARMQALHRKEKEFGLDHADSVLNELYAAGAIISWDDASLPGTQRYDVDGVHAARLLGFSAGTDSPLPKDGRIRAPTSSIAPALEHTTTQRTFEAFLDELEEALADPAKRQWLRTQVFDWLSAAAAQDGDGEKSDEPIPWPPEPGDYQSVAAQCAALAAVHDEFFRGPRLFPIPATIANATADGESTHLFEALAWRFLVDAVRSNPPERQLIVLRAMLRSVNAAWTATGQSAPESSEGQSPIHEAVLTPNVVPDDAMLSAASILNNFGIPPARASRLKGKLDRFRKANKGSTDWQEVPERGPREPKYLYRAGAIRSMAMEVRNSPE